MQESCCNDKNNFSMKLLVEYIPKNKKSILCCAHCPSELNYVWRFIIEESKIALEFAKDYKRVHIAVIDANSSTIALLKGSTSIQIRVDGIVHLTVGGTNIESGIVYFGYDPKEKEITPIPIEAFDISMENFHPEFISPEMLIDSIDENELALEDSTDSSTVGEES